MGNRLAERGAGRAPAAGKASGRWGGCNRHTGIFANSDANNELEHGLLLHLGGPDAWGQAVGFACRP